MSRTVKYKRYYCAVCYRSMAVLQPKHEDEFEPCDGCGESGKWVADPLKYVDEQLTEGTSIDFRLHGISVSGKTKTWKVQNRQNSTILGTIDWWSNWRKYCFAPDACMVFDHSCMREIALFIQQQTRLHMKKLAEARKAAKEKA